MYNYERMTKPLYKRPLYKDPKDFIAILVIVLVAILIAEMKEKEPPPDKVPVENTK